MIILLIIMIFKNNSYIFINKDIIFPIFKLNCLIIKIIIKRSNFSL